MNDQHQQAAEEVWNACPIELKSQINRADFIMAFTLGRVSMKAGYDKAELLKVGEEPKPFTQQN